MKLELKDIKILNEAQQYKKAIIDAYGSIRAFAQKEKYYPLSTIKSYLSQSNLSINFQYFVASALGKDPDEIVISETEQVQRFVEQIYDGIKVNYVDYDLETLIDLMKLCDQYSMSFEASKMHRNIGLCYLNQKEHYLAIEHLIKACSIVRSKDDLLLVEYLNDLSYIYLFLKSYKKYEEVIDEINSIIERVVIRDELLQLYFYRVGLYYNRTGKYLEARAEMKKSSVYAYKTNNFREVGCALLNIGLSYKREKKFAKALIYYFRALRLYKTYYKENVCIVYNNIAELYRVVKKYTRAELNAKHAMQIVNPQDQQNYYLCFFTYLQIKFEMGYGDKALNDLVNLIDKDNDKFIHRKYIVDGIATIIEYGREFSDLNTLQKLDLILFRMYQNDGYEELRTEVILHLGQVRIYIKLIEGGC